MGVLMYFNGFVIFQNKSRKVEGKSTNIRIFLETPSEVQKINNLSNILTKVVIQFRVGNSIYITDCKNI